MNDNWQDDDEVTTTYRTINMMRKEFFDAGFAAGVAWVESQTMGGV